MTLRAVTVGERAQLRGPGQHSETYLWVHNPATIFSARVNQAVFAEPVIAVTYDGGSGSYGDILPGMTLRIGSTAGADDLGKVRVRQAASATVLFVGAMGGVAWADNAYLTVVDDFELWWKRAVLQGDNTYLLDEEVVYSDQHLALDPVPVMGCDAAAWLAAGSAVVTWRGAPWVLGSTISGHAWSVTPAAGVTVTNGTTANASMTFTAAGTYRVGYTVTAANGKTATGYRFAYIFDAAHPPMAKIRWEKISGERESGGYGTVVEVWDQAGLEQVRPGARALMFARDYFGGTPQDLGPLVGRENVLLAGWIDGEVLRGDPRLGSVRFNVSNAGGMLRKVSGQPVFCKDTGGAPERWTRFEQMTLDHFLWHLCHWRSTVDAVMDVFLSGDTRRAGEFSTEADTLWEKLYNVGQHRLLARPGVNRYGQLFVRREAQTLSAAERAGLATVRTLEKQDWEPPLEFERVVEPQVAGIELSGMAYDGPGSFRPFYSRAPGTAALRAGHLEVRDNLMLVDQAELNALAGRVLAQKNNAYASVPVVLKANDRFVDCMEPAWVAMNLAAGDTPRGIVWAGQRLIVTRVELVWNAGTGRMHTEIECEAETVGRDGVTILPPSIPKSNIIAGGKVGGGLNGPFLWPPRLVFTPPVIVYQPPVTAPPVVVPVDGCLTLAPENGPWDTWLRGSCQNNAPSAYGTLKCILRSAAVTHGSKYRLNGKFYSRANANEEWAETTDDSFYTVYAVGSNANRLVTGIKDALGDDPHFRGGSFGPAGATEIGGVELSLGTSGAVALAGSPTHYLQPPQVGLGNWGTILNDDFVNVQLTPVIYAVLNGTFTLGPTTALNRYHEVDVDLVFATGSSGSYKIRLRAAEFSPVKFAGAQLTYYNGIGIGSPEVPITEIVPEVTGLEGEFTFNFDNWPAGKVLRLVCRMGWAAGDNHTVVFRLDTWVEPVATKRIDVESLTLYNVCPLGSS